jgi:hypothetical protein
MILQPGNPWGKLRGKLSTTPEQALRQFGFTQAPTASGVMFRIYGSTDAFGRTKGNNYIDNYYPSSNPQSEAQQNMRARFSMLIKLACANQHTLIYPIWKLAAESKSKPLTPQNVFVSMNTRRMSTALDYGNLLISTGILDKAEITNAIKTGANSYQIDWDTQLHNNAENTDIVTAYIMDLNGPTLLKGLTAGTPQRSDGTYEWEFLTETENFVAYIFLNRDKLYSRSTSKEVITVVAYPEQVNDAYTGDINGVNTVFTTTKGYIPERIKVFLNGVRQKISLDYTESDADEITFATAPETGDILTIDFYYYF